MKPYLLALYNCIKYKLISVIKGDAFNYKGLLLLGWNTKLLIHPNSMVVLDEKIISDGRVSIITDNNSKLFIGKNVYFNEGTMISCKGKIIIGNGCRFGPNVMIFDNNHKFTAIDGVNDNHSIGVIEIGNNCWIGANVVILKNTKIGNNVVIGAGCVIDGEIPDATIVTQARELFITKMES